jgi:hypothetical protein
VKIAIVKELFEFLFRRKRYWIIPIVVLFLAMALLILLTEGSAIAPFIYSLF